MTGPWPYLVALPAAYLVGSIPFGVLVGRLWAGIDIRTVGSGNSGATNMLRSVGPVPAALVLLADLGKGVATVLIRASFPTPPWSPHWPRPSQSQVIAGQYLPASGVAAA